MKLGPNVLKHKRLLKWCLAVTLGMFGFSYALVPMYSVFCKVTGLNGKTNSVALNVEPTTSGVDESRWVTIQFMATNNEDLPWEFYPKTFEVKVHPGAVTETAFFAHNTTGQKMTVQAIPSVSPGLAAAHLQKLECFCFTQQALAANTSRWMPLQFVISRDLPPEITTLTLSYTLFDLSEHAEIHKHHTPQVSKL